MAYIVKELLHYCNVTITGSPIPSRVISYYDLSFVLKGKMVYVINGRRVELGENDAICLPPGTIRQRLAGEQKAEFVSFNFQVLEGKELAFPCFMKNAVTREIRKLVEVFPLRHLSAMGHAKEKLTNLLNYVLFDLSESLGFESNHPDILRIKKFVEERLTTRITLAMLREHVHLSEEYISALFKKNVGKTLIEYVNERKMLLAKQMIDEGTLSLREVADNLGFEHYGYFSRLFKKHFGDPPARLKGKTKR